MTTQGEDCTCPNKITKNGPVIDPLCPRHGQSEGCTCYRSTSGSALDPRCPKHGSQTSTPERIARARGECTCPNALICPQHGEDARQAAERLAELAKQPGTLVPESGSVSEQASERREKRWGRLEKAGPRANLIRLLAREGHTQRQLAAMHDVSVSSINEFSQRHREEIQARKEADTAALDKVWIASKESRLFALEDLYDKLDKGELDTDVVRTAKDLLRAAAEELGQIPNKTTVVQAQPFEVRILDDNTASQLTPDDEQEGVDDGEGL